MLAMMGYLFVEELCGILRTSSRIQRHAIEALARRQVAVPDVWAHKWRKTNFFHPLDECRSNFWGRFAHWEEGQACYVAAIARRCPNVEVIESGCRSKDWQPQELHKRRFHGHYEKLTTEVGFPSRCGHKIRSCQVKQKKYKFKPLRGIQGQLLTVAL